MSFYGEKVSNQEFSAQPLSLKHDENEVAGCSPDIEQPNYDKSDYVTTNEYGLKKYYDEASIHKSNQFIFGDSYNQEVNMVQKIILTHYILSSKFEDDNFKLLSNFYMDTHSCGEVYSCNSSIDSGEVGRLNRMVSFFYEEAHYTMLLKSYSDGMGVVRCNCVLFTNKSIKVDNVDSINTSHVFRLLMKNSMRHSIFQGKLLEFVMNQGNFESLNIVNVKHKTEVSLDNTQKKYIQHFIKRLQRGNNNLRVLFNGVPGSGKTESIRNIVAELLPDYTCIIPKFNHLNELKIIFEEVKIFEKVVVLLDDIDLYLGSRKNQTQTSLIGEFLSFFDGIRKNTISIIASTNDKNLVDSAAERPGRFNFIIDFDYLTKEQIKEVIDIHFHEKFKDERIYNYFNNNKKIGSNDMKITGAFLANLAANLEEIVKDQEEWTVDDTIQLIEDSYKGFYSSQTKKVASMSFV